MRGAPAAHCARRPLHRQARPGGRMRLPHDLSDCRRPRRPGEVADRSRPRTRPRVPLQSTGRTDGGRRAAAMGEGAGQWHAVRPRAAVRRRAGRCAPLGDRQCGRTVCAAGSGRSEPHAEGLARNVERRAWVGPWLALAVAALWIAAAGIEFSVPSWGRVVAKLGDAYPLPTAWALGAARLHLAWWIAGAWTLLVATLWLRRSRWCTAACALALFASAAGATLAAWAMALPFYLS